MEKNKNNAMEKVEKVIREKHGEVSPEQKNDATKNGGERKDFITSESKSKSGGKNVGLKAAVVSLSVATAILGGALITTLTVPSDNDVALEGGYRKSFYETVTQVDNIDLNLSKVLATKDEKAMQEYFTDLAVNGELAENELQALPIEDESKFYTTKLVNQIADFAKYANKKLIDGESLSKKDFETLNTLYKANLNLKNSLAEINGSMDESFKFTDLKEGDGGALKGFLTELENLSVEMPELIYDGPFSDGKDKVVPKGLTEETVGEDVAKKTFVNLFGERGLKDISMDGETNSQVECYNYSATAGGQYLYAQISKSGGKLVMMAMSGSCSAEKIERRVALDRAVKFSDRAGIVGLKPVWVNLANNVYTVNLAFEQDGVIVYPDLVKVRVCAETGSVIGYEAASYYMNHAEREIPSAKISESQARAKVSDGIKVESVRLCVIPATENTEKLCYEFCGSQDGSTYYVYIDAKTGRQAEMFKVVEGTEGTLLM